MPAAAIIQLIAQVGIPAARELLDLYTRQEPADVTAQEWLALLGRLSSYNDLRSQKVTTPSP